MRHVKTQINIKIRLVWTEPFMSAWRNIECLINHLMRSEYSYHTWWMPRLTRVSTLYTLYWVCHFMAQIHSGITRLLCHCLTTSSTGSNLWDQDIATHVAIQWPISHLFDNTVTELVLNSVSIKGYFAIAYTTNFATRKNHIIIIWFFYKKFI